MRKLFLLIALCAAPSLAAAQSIPKSLSCEGVFARDSNHARLVKIFGAANVHFMKVMDLYDEVQASVVYLRDEKRKLEFHWTDAKARKGLSSLRVGASHSIWKLGNGIGMGAPLEKILALNGKPISIQGFGTEVEGRVDFDGGALAKLPGGCMVRIHLHPGGDAPETLMEKVSGEGSFSSNDPNMRALKLAVSIIAIEWQ